MIFKEAIRKEITPTRLLALLRLVSKKRYSKNELAELIQPKAFSSTASEFKLIFKFAEDAGLIFDDIDGFVKLKIDGSKVMDDELYKDLLKDILIHKQTVFGSMTEWMLSQGKEMLEWSGASRFLSQISSGVPGVNEEMVLAWRFWFKYLGYGFNLSDEFIIANPYKRVKRILDTNQSVRKGETVQVKEFIGWIEGGAWEMTKGISGNNLSWPISLALRTLHDQGEIELKHVFDATDNWHLEKMEMHEINTITHVIVKG